MKKIKQYEFWFVVGSQFLYGPETLKDVSVQSEKMVAGLNKAEKLPCKIVLKDTVKTNKEILDLVKEANNNDKCAGILTWMHTFSPSKMWINGLSILQKPYCHFHTQFNRNIPNDGIDMDFMNLNQSAHGDREHGFIAARMRIPRKIVVGYWEDKEPQEHIASWMRSAVGYGISQNLTVVRFGDNMRNVAVTEGDKVEAQIKLGWQVNTWAVGDLVSEMNSVTEKDIDKQIEEYKTLYTFDKKDIETIRYQAKEEIGIRRILERENAGAYTNTFEDLHGIKQLPGLASQNLMSKGYGYGGEGDWKVSALTHIVKQMTEGLKGGTSFMEDYTYDLELGNELSLGAHMLEVCPSVAKDKPKIEVHDLGIGDREPPARLVFEGGKGDAVAISMVDMGGRLRLIVQDIECIEPTLTMPNLPVARVMWKPAPNLITGAHAWILAGGAHHTVLSYSATVEMMEDWADMLGIEFVHIGKDTTISQFKKDLFLSDIAWKLSK